MSISERSVSRGREVYSSGRGGLGNIRQTSLSRDARSETGPDDFSLTRGRELVGGPNQVLSTGRGGAGNIRSPSRDVQKAPIVNVVEDDDVIKGYKKSQEGAPVSSGRGGLGNINRSRSRDPASNPMVHSPLSCGNVIGSEGDVKGVHGMDEENHSTTGGVNIHAPAIEHQSHIGEGCQSTGGSEAEHKTT